MDFVPPDWTPSARARMQRRRSKNSNISCKTGSIDAYKCVRHAWIVHATEWARTRPLTLEDRSQSIPLLVGRAAWRFGWMTTTREIRRPGYTSGRWGPPRPVEIVEREAIPETVLQARVAGIVADLIADWEPEAQAAKSARGQRTSMDHPAADAPAIVALQDRVAQTQGISLRDWGRQHHIAYTVLFEWRRAGGKAIKGRVSTKKADEIEDAVRRDALELGLIRTHTDSD